MYLILKNSMIVSLFSLICYGKSIWSYVCDLKTFIL